MIYDVDYFIQKFEAIPESQWIVHNQGGVGKDDPHCAVGHCVNEDGQYGRSFAFTDIAVSPMAHYMGWRFSAEAAALSLLFSDDDMGVNKVILINNGDDREYQQPTPKQRILAALRDVKRMQEDQQVKPDEKEVIIKHKITYVVIPESVSKGAKETILS